LRSIELITVEIMSMHLLSSTRFDTDRVGTADAVEKANFHR